MTALQGFRRCERRQEDSEDCEAIGTRGRGLWRQRDPPIRIQKDQYKKRASQRAGGRRHAARGRATAALLVLFVYDRSTRAWPGPVQQGLEEQF